jgi:hypothetical protein
MITEKENELIGQLLSSPKEIAKKYLDKIFTARKDLILSLTLDQTMGQANVMKLTSDIDAFSQTEILRQCELSSEWQNISWNQYNSLINNIISEWEVHNDI